MKRIMYAMACAALAAVPALAQSTAAPQTTAPAPKTAQTKMPDKAHQAGMPDKAHHAEATAKGFLTEAAMNGMAEVDLAHLAETKASNAKVKSLAQKLAMDHGKANDEVKRLAETKNVTLPSATDAAKKVEHDRLAAMSGAAFDRAFVRMMAANHTKGVAEFKYQASSNQDAEVKAWAAATLPTLEEHLRSVQALEKELTGKSSTR